MGSVTLANDKNGEYLIVRLDTAGVDLFFEKLARDPAYTALSADEKTARRRRKLLQLGQQTIEAELDATKNPLAQIEARAAKAKAEFERLAAKAEAMKSSAAEVAAAAEVK